MLGSSALRRATLTGAAGPREEAAGAIKPASQGPWHHSEPLDVAYSAIESLYLLQAQVAGQFGQV